MSAPFSDSSTNPSATSAAKSATTDAPTPTPPPTAPAPPQTSAAAPTAEPEPTTPTVDELIDSAPSDTALAALGSLAVKGRAPRTGYARKVFGQAWADTDRNGCDKRVISSSLCA